MDDIIDGLMGVDKRVEIFTLWYEITFLRMVLNKVLEFNTELHTKMTEEVYEEVRKRSKDIVKSRFPNIGIDFSKPRVINQEPTSPIQEDESKRNIRFPDKHIEGLPSL